jgi:hypothetical protein
VHYISVTELDCRDFTADIGGWWWHWNLLFVEQSKPWRWRSEPKIQNGSSQALFVLMNDDAGVLALCFSFQQSN